MSKYLPGYTLKADITQYSRHVSKVPIGDIREMKETTNRGGVLSLVNWSLLEPLAAAIPPDLRASRTSFHSRRGALGVARYF